MLDHDLNCPITVGGNDARQVQLLEKLRLACVITAHRDWLLLWKLRKSTRLLKLRGKFSFKNPKKCVKLCFDFCCIYDAYFITWWGSALSKSIWCKRGSTANHWVVSLPLSHSWSSWVHWKAINYTFQDEFRPCECGQYWLSNSSASFWEMMQGERYS